MCRPPVIIRVLVPTLRVGTLEISVPSPKGRRGATTRSRHDDAPFLACRFCDFRGGSRVVCFVVPAGGRRAAEPDPATVFVGYRPDLAVDFVREPDRRPRCGRNGGQRPRRRPERRGLASDPTGRDGPTLRHRRPRHDPPLLDDHAPRAGELSQPRDPRHLGRPKPSQHRVSGGRFLRFRPRQGNALPIGRSFGRPECRHEPLAADAVSETGEVHPEQRGRQAAADLLPNDLHVGRQTCRRRRPTARPLPPRESHHGEKRF